jgi:hypothetical protein
MTTAPRTFKLVSPHMQGDDIRAFQRDLNTRFDAWDIGKHIDDDGDYGSETRRSAAEVCIGLGILPEEAMSDGVTPGLRVKIRHPNQRTAREIDRSTGTRATRFRAALRERFNDAGRVIIAPGANLPGKAIQPITLQYITRMAGFLGQSITITTGTNHSKLTSSGSISDHFSGNAADMGMLANGGTNDSPVGDHIMTAGLVLAGVPLAKAKADAHAGGLFNFVHEGLRIQCIWKTLLGGNHHNHVHIGVRPAA